jgi:hypothetical protein
MSQNILATSHDEVSLPQGSLAQPLAEYFRTHGITAPPVELTLAFSPHGTAEDINWVEDLYRVTDVYIPEMVNWTPEGVARWEKVAHGDADSNHIVETYVRNIMNDQHHFMKEYSIAKMKLVARYPGKYLCVIDLPAGSALGTDVRVALAAVSILRHAPKATHHFEQTSRKRDTQMLLNLSPALGNLIRRFPGLGQKERLKVLLTLGSNHARMRDPLVKRGEDVKVFSKEH